ncbi:hypothetical protein [Amycolatopsis pigmentata]|uniref:Uncharacterized protein n=1 Tax=Amycolatopsis pigmentata TaxID=450801 RepID=A0ABW5FP30_9PSEU
MVEMVEPIDRGRLADTGISRNKSECVSRGTKPGTGAGGFVRQAGEGGAAMRDNNW